MTSAFRLPPRQVIIMRQRGGSSMAEHRLPKPNVEGSSPFRRLVEVIGDFVQLPESGRPAGCGRRQYGVFGRIFIDNQMMPIGRAGAHGRTGVGDLGGSCPCLGVLSVVIQRVVG